VREVDRVGRFGGEEFVVLLPGLDLSQAAETAEVLRARLAAQRMERDGGSLSMSASFGVAEWSGPSEEPSRLLMRADQALYQAKRAGRNRVQVTGTGIDMEPNDPIAA
jgi:diguanylate cyclase (GGDEF)-like protein